MGLEAEDEPLATPWWESIQAIGGFNATLLELVKTAALKQGIPFLDGSVIRPARYLQNGVWFKLRGCEKESLFQLKILWLGGEWVAWLSSALE